MDDYEEIVNSVRGIVKPAANALPKVQEEEPDDYDSIIKSVRSPVTTPVQMESTPQGTFSAPDVLPGTQEVPGFTGHKVHPMVSKIAMEYYGKTDPKEALDTWVADQTWNNANAAMALIDAVKAQTADPIKAKQMAFLGEEFDKLPSFWEGDRPITEKASRLWANVWRGIVDPVTWAGGAVGGKVASMALGKSAGILSRAGGAAAFDVAGGAAAEASMETMKVSVGRQEEVDPLKIAETAAISGLTGGVVRGGAGLLKRVFSKPEVPPPAIGDKSSNAANDNPLDYEQARINARMQLEPQDNPLGVLERAAAQSGDDFKVPESINQNKFPEMEVTRPIKDEPDGILARQEDEPLFDGLRHLDNDLDEPHVVPIKDSGRLAETEPAFGKDNPLHLDNIIGDYEPIKDDPKIKHKDTLDAIITPKDDTPKDKNIGILKQDGTPPPKIPLDDKPPIYDDGRTPLLVKLLNDITGKDAVGQTHLNLPMEAWAETLTSSQKIPETFHVTKAQAMDAATRAGLNGPEAIENLAKVVGSETGDKLHWRVMAASRQHQLDAMNSHTLASNLNEKIWKFGSDSPEAREARAGYLLMKANFTDGMKRFAGARSELGRSLAMLRPNETLEQQINRINKDLDKPSGLKDNGLIDQICGF